MRKRIVSEVDPGGACLPGAWLDLDQLATIEITSEDPAHCIESALSLDRAESTVGWRAASPGTQAIRVLLDEPQRLRRIWLHFAEPVVERAQEFVVRWSAGAGRPFHDVVRQQWNFSPSGSTTETEDFHVDLVGVTVLEIVITPDVRGPSVPASLMRLRIA